jgi:hypothetical protein
VIVADPNFAPMYATRSRRTKTDRRDARTLMEACRLGAYRPAYRLSDARRHVRAGLAVREALVRTRTRYIALAKALVRRDGLRVATSESHLVAKRIAALELSDALSAELLPLFEVLVPINEQIAAADRRLAALARTDAEMVRLATAPSISPITVSAVVATVDHRPFRVGTSLRSIPGPRARGAELGREASHRVHHEGGEYAGPISVGRGRLAHSAREGSGDGGVVRVGTADRGASWETNRRRGDRASARGDSVRDVARPAELRRDETADAAGRSAGVIESRADRSRVD